MILTDLELEKKISTAFYDIVPDNFEKIYANFLKIKKQKIFWTLIYPIAFLTA